MTISKISLFNCFARPEKTTPNASCPTSQFLKENPISKTCFNIADRVWHSLTGRIQRLDPRQCPLIRTCLSKKPAHSLSTACSTGQIEMVQRFLKAGANVNLVENGCGGWTPLHWACLKGHTEIARLLVDAGANIDLVNANGKTALYLACDKGHVGIVRLLLEAGANANLANENGWTPLHCACAKGSVGIAKLLIEKKVSLFDRTLKGFTPLNFIKDVQLLRVLTGTEAIKVFDACKDIHDFCALLFPPSKEVPPPNWESLVGKFPKDPKLLELEKEKTRLQQVSIRPSFDAIDNRLNATSNQKKKKCYSIFPFTFKNQSPAILPIKTILEILLKMHPLFAKAWELADYPDLEEVAEHSNTNVNPKGIRGSYLYTLHKISIEESSNQLKLLVLIFETMNALQRASVENIQKLNELTREEYAFLVENLEKNSADWFRVLIDSPNAVSADPIMNWKSVNTPFAEGFVSHTEAIRRQWDGLYFPRWLETHPVEFKQRLAELEKS